MVGFLFLFYSKTVRLNLLIFQIFMVKFLSFHIPKGLRLLNSDNFQWNLAIWIFLYPLNISLIIYLAYPSMEGFQLESFINSAQPN